VGEKGAPSEDYTAPPCPFVSSCQPTTRGPPAAVHHLQSGQLCTTVDRSAAAPRQGWYYTL